MTDFETLVRESCLLLKDACVPKEVAVGEDGDETPGPSTISIDGGEHALAEALAAAVRAAEEMELPLVARASDSAEAAALRANVARLRTMQSRVADVKEKMTELQAAYASVTARTCSLHDACERALKNQTHLAAMAEQIKANLHYFKQADAIFKKLSSGSKLSVTGQSFTSLLASIDECLHFLRSHPEWKESELYISKYEQCLSRAMTCIRGAVLADLEAAANDVRLRRVQFAAQDARAAAAPLSAANASSGLSDEDTLTLLYGVFASRADSVKSALAVAESRFAGVPEFEAMLSECQQVYFTIRQTLLDPVLEATLTQLASTHFDSSCTLTRSGCSFLLRVIDDEFRIYRQFFSVGEDRFGGAKTPGAASVRGGAAQTPTSPASSSFFWSATSSFDEFAEGICRLLYNMLRPMVIHNPHLETLTELCAILKVEMIEQRCGLVSPMLFGHAGGTESVGGRSIASTRGFGRNGGGRMGHSAPFDPRGGFVRVMGELVGDIAERVVYRAELYAQSDIGGYRPAPGDLAYPEKLEMMREIEQRQTAPKPGEGAETEENGGDGEAKTEGDVVARKTSSAAGALPSAVDLHCLWYPTVRRTVMCLAKLFKYLDMGVFQSLARDLLMSCCDSLDAAALAIAASPKKKQGGWPRALDAELFVVKHLLILREQTAPYRAAAQRSDASLPTKDLTLDFTKFRATASALLGEGRSRWFELSSNNAFLELLFQVPIHVSEPTGDSRRIIDAHLRQRCNQLVAVAADLVCRELAAHVTAAEAEAAAEGFDAKKSAALAPKALQNVSAASYKHLNQSWPQMRAALSLYVSNPETEAILLTPIRTRITEVWTRLHALATAHLDEEGRAIAALPALSHIHLITRS